MPVPIALERFPFAVLRDGQISHAHLALRSSWDGKSYQLFRANSAIKRVVISCHGSGSNAQHYCDFAAWGAMDAGVAQETLVIAPQIICKRDLSNPQDLALEPGLLYWGARSRAFNGYESEDEEYPRRVKASAFEALNHLLEYLTRYGVFPNIETVVITGHSAGGQMTLRYAVSSRYEPPEGVQIRYVPMNPGSVIYLSPKRARALGSGIEFVVPTDEMLQDAIDTSVAAGHDAKSLDWTRERYDHYRYGAQELIDPGYHAGLSRQDLRDNFSRRAIAYLVGANDTGTPSNLPGSPQAQLQGRHRVERSRWLQAHLGDEGLWDNYRHVRREVPGVGHDGEATLRSPLGLFYIYGYESAGMPNPEFDPNQALLAEAYEILREIELRVPRAPQSPGNRLRTDDGRLRDGPEPGVQPGTIFDRGARRAEAIRRSKARQPADPG